MISAYPPSGRQDNFDTDWYDRPNDYNSQGQSEFSSPNINRESSQPEEYAPVNQFPTSQNRPNYSNGMEQYGYAYQGAETRYSESRL